jgi:hypothetical protein
MTPMQQLQLYFAMLVMFAMAFWLATHLALVLP